MGNKVILSIKSSQKGGGNDGETVEFLTEGELTREGEDLLLTYRESELTGMGDTCTTLRLERGRLTVLRQGEYNTQMIFEPGVRHFSFYETPYGSMTVGVETGRLKADLGETGGEITLEYSLEVDHALVSRNRFQIRVREKESPGEG